MDELSPVNVIQETSFHLAWQKAAAFIVAHGIDRVIGGPKQSNPEIIERKVIRDTCQLIVLTGEAITQMYNFEMHPKFPYGPKQLKEYCLQLTPEYVDKWRSLPKDDIHRVRYLYLDRMLFPFNQLEAMRINLAGQISNHISSNRTQVITWQPTEDAFNDEPPCLQRIQIIYLGAIDGGVGRVDLRFDWRSHDINALQANSICLLKAISIGVLFPNNCIPIRWIDYNASLHCYADRLPDLHEAAWYQRTGSTYFYK